MSSTNALPVPASATVTLRPAHDGDYPFMRGLYESTREEEMRLFPFDRGEKATFLDRQFAAQHQYYLVHYPTCERNIVEIGGQPIGRLWVDEWRDQIRLVDIALLPEWRGRRIGSALVRQVLDRGTRTGKAVTIHVEMYNPALGLYERLGFQKVDTNGVYLLMRWSPK